MNTCTKKSAGGFTVGGAGSANAKWAGLLLTGLVGCAGGLLAAEPPATSDDVESLRLVRGAVNGALIERNGKVLAVYGDPREQPAAAETVLFTHARRDVVWAGRSLVVAGAKAVAPAAETASFADASAFWSAFETKRFHDYDQQTTKVPGESLAVAQSARGGETLVWEGLPIRVLDTPGFTRGAVSYAVELAGRRVMFTGDLIYGEGKLFELYSLQDAIPAAKVGGYHGHAGRLGDLIASLRRVLDNRPDVLIPARGPVIRDPQAAILRLISRVQAYYTNYLSIDALRWYFHDDHMTAKARRVLEPGAQVGWMPMAETQERLPAWIVPIDNARLVLSEDRTGLLVDCGSQHILDELGKLRAANRLVSIDHVFITHYHDDHTDQVARLVELFGASVLASPRNWEVLEHPEDHRLPCLTRNPIPISARVTDGARWRWKEFELRLFYFPGQTLYHDALLVKKDTGEEYFFIGDSFTPSGVDDYCLLNRNWLHDDQGFLYCLDLLKRSAPNAWLINQHVGPAFRFSAAQLEFMSATLRQRRELLRALLPWEDPNFGLDESWARFHPYAVGVRPGEVTTLDLRVMNHSAREEVFTARVILPAAWTVQSLQPARLRIPPNSEGAFRARIAVPVSAATGARLVTADLRWGDWDLREWTEALVQVRP